jgi:hypothetical protein
MSLNTDFHAPFHTQYSAQQWSVERIERQEWFLQCQTPISTIGLKDEGGRMEREE